MPTIRLVSPQHRARAMDAIRAAADGWIMRLGEPTRTLEQNAKLWPMLDDLREQVPEMWPYSTDDIKARFLHALGVEMRFLPVLEGAGVFPVGLRSSTLTKEQFSGLIELLFAYGAKHGVRWSDTSSGDECPPASPGPEVVGLSPPPANGGL